jgi:hypothetical protein
MKHSRVMHMFLFEEATSETLAAEKGLHLLRFELLAAFKTTSETLAVVGALSPKLFSQPYLAMVNFLVSSPARRK